MRIECRIDRCFRNNAPDVFEGHIIVYEKNALTWSLTTGIYHRYRALAMIDARELRRKTLERAGL
jgi:hypothetical protein